MPIAHQTTKYAATICRSIPSGILSLKDASSKVRKTNSSFPYTYRLAMDSYFVYQTHPMMSRAVSCYKDPVVKKVTRSSDIPNSPHR